MSNPGGVKQFLAIYVRGLLMGAADVVPGVSGGTVALIVGIYARLVTALSSFDLTLLDHLRKGRIRKAVEHVDLVFLVSLLAGVATAILSMARVMTWLIMNKPVPTWSFFFGLVLASSWLVGRMVNKWSPRELALLALGAALAWWVVGLIPVETPQTLPMVFFSGAIAICAMILPGISGSFVLVILGQYLHVLDALKSKNIPVVLVFCAGCAVGLLSFTKLLRWVLAKAYTPTLVFLCGLMLGSLRKIWPWKVEAPGQEHLKPKHRIELNIIPETFSSPEFLAIATFVAGVALVLIVDYIARRSEEDPASQGAQVSEQMEGRESTG